MVAVFTTTNRRLNSTNTAEALSTEQIQSLVVSTLEDLKAEEISIIDVRGRSPLTDVMVVASGRSSRHVKSISDNLILKAKAAGLPPLGVEGDRQSEWVLVDLNDVIVHLMLPQTRAFYNIEKLWSASEQRRANATGAD